MTGSPQLAISIVLALLLATQAGCSGDEAAVQLRVENLEYQLLPDGTRMVSGAVHNDGKARVDAAQIQISLFDENNRRIDGMYAVVRDIPAGGSVEFREPVQSELDVNGARVRSILPLD